MGASDWAFRLLQQFIYLKDFSFLFVFSVWQSTERSVTEHRKFDAYEHYAAICEGHNALC